LAGNGLLRTKASCSPHASVIETFMPFSPSARPARISDLPGLNGLQVASQLHEHLPNCKALVVTGLTQPGHPPRPRGTRPWLHAQRRPGNALADATRRVAAGERVLDPDLVAAAIETGSSPLTPREADVLRAAEIGLTTDEIAAKLFLSPPPCGIT
jgi:two-component system, NarL family, response regulator DesR